MSQSSSDNLLHVSLTEQEVAGIHREAALYPEPGAAAIDALLLVQKNRGWISDPVLALIARELSMTETELDGVASFYNLIFRRPVGRYVIKCCDSVSCWLHDGDGLYRHIQSRLGIQPGQTTDDGLFTLLPCVCLGDCDNAPALMINDDHHHQLTPQGIDQILDDLRLSDNNQQEAP